MFTSAECRAIAEQKLADAERDPQHRERLRKAAEAWVILANQLIRVEGVKRPDWFIAGVRGWPLT
jgi:hypothetical protein